MFQFAVLGSGSKGNAILVSSPAGLVLIDAGFSAKQIRQRMASLGASLNHVAAVLITHEHSDHIRGLRVLTSQLPPATPVFASSRTAYCVRDSLPGFSSWKCFEPGDVFPILDLSISTFSISHDAAEPVGYRFDSAASRSLGIVSDTGRATNTILNGVNGVHSIYVEANYDPTLLANDTRRPFPTKQRIASSHGHLSNLQSAQLVAEIDTGNLHSAVLGHLSSDCNTPDIALATVRQHLDESGKSHINLHCSTQDDVLGWIPV